ncbi:hypothetical protein ACGFXC_10185 [Streptomyces sp. NPDC048507]|uniref:hypothetical protein n=1 Tax=Streptomyces sp. NPDC048507 TaxID=3365560 RepID=UPI00371D79C0
MDMDERQPPPGAEGCLAGVLRVPVKIVAVLVVLPVRVGWDVLVAATRLLYRHLLGPAGRGLGRFHARVLRPVLGVLGRAAVLLLKLVFVWPWATLWRHALAPAGRGLAWLGRAAATYLLRPLGRALALAGRAVFVWPAVALWRYVVRPVGGAAWRHLLVPLGRAALARVLAPLGRLLAGAWQQAGRISRALGRGLVLLWRALVARPCAWAHRRVATPAGHLVREVWRGARAAVREARDEVRRALFGRPPREPARSRARTLGSTTAVGTAPAPEISLPERRQG